jgi:DNA-binding IclR family transcriptional regulator
MLQILVDRNYIAYTARGKGYAIGCKFGDIWFRNFGRGFCEYKCRRLLEDLNRALGDESCFLAFFSDFRYYPVVQALCTQPLSAGPIFECPDLHATALGKVYLASMQMRDIKKWIDSYGLPKITENTITAPDVLLRELETVSAKGYAVNRAENLNGIFSMAVSIETENFPLMGLAFTMPVLRYDPADLHMFAKIMKTYAKKISQVLSQSSV